jgi:hypothetical protein
VQVDSNLLTDLVRLAQKHHSLYPLPILLFLRIYLTADRLKSFIRKLGDVYVELCSTVEKCVKSTKRLISSISTKPETQPQRNAIISSRTSDREQTIEHGKHSQGSTGRDFEIATGFGASGR